MWARCAHGVRFAGPRLAVGKNGDIVALDEGVDAVGDIFKHAFLLDVLAKDAVEDEDLATSRSIHGQTRGGSDVAGCAAKALGDEFIARFASFERRTHADSCIRAYVRAVLWVRGVERSCAQGWDVPTLTAVLLLSSSDALLPPPSLLLMLRRLELRFERIMALMGRGTPLAGEVGGEVAIACGYGSAVVWARVVRCPERCARRFCVWCLQGQGRR